MNRRLVLLSVVAVALGLYELAPYLGGFGTGGSDAPAPPAADSGGGSAVKLNPLQGAEAPSYAAILDRPLFNPGRRPRPVEPVATVQPQVEPPSEPPPPPPPPAPGPEDYRLLGVASGPDGRIAALRVAASGEVLYLRKDDTIESWTVIDISDRSVSIGTPDNPVTYSLFENADGDDGQPVDPAQPPPMTGPAQVQPQPIPQPIVPPGVETEQLPVDPPLPHSLEAPPPPPGNGQ